MTFISVGENNSDGIDGFLDIINTLIKETNRPTVLTTSYGFNEPANNTGFTQLATWVSCVPLGDTPDTTCLLLRSLCNLYAQLGARGVSVIYAAGDSGVAGTFMNNPANCSNSEFVPTFPSGCP